jgi:hypothetical protein
VNEPASRCTALIPIRRSVYLSAHSSIHRKLGKAVNRVSNGPFDLHSHARRPEAQPGPSGSGPAPSHAHAFETCRRPWPEGRAVAAATDRAR